MIIIKKEIKMKIIKLSICILGLLASCFLLALLWNLTIQNSDLRDIICIVSGMPIGIIWGMTYITWVNL